MSPISTHRYPDDCSSQDCRRSGVQTSLHDPSFTDLSPYGPQLSDIERDLHEVLQAARTIKNTFLPVNRLPPEILSTVLENRTSDLDLVAATHVCRHWRSILISTPSFWTRFRFQPTRDVSRALTYFERSKSAPIDIEMNVHSQLDLEFSKHLAPHIARTRSLIIGGDPDLVHATSLLLRNTAPFLQHLELHSLGLYAPLPDNLLSQHVLSLRCLRLRNVGTTFKSPFPLANLIEFELRLQEDAAPSCMTTLFLFLSGSPRLERIRIDTNEVLQDIVPDQFILLESVVELEYSCGSAGRILPYLRLPRLEQLSVCSQFGFGPVQKLADILPHDGHLLLEGTTKMEYRAYLDTHTLVFHGKNGDATLVMHLDPTNPTPVYWLSDTKYIPFRQIQELTVGCSSDNADPPITAFENLEVLQIAPRSAMFNGPPFTEELFRVLYPGAEVPCHSLRVVRYTGWEPLDPLISLVKARLQAGHRLELVELPTIRKFSRRCVDELRKLVGEVVIRRLKGT